MSSPWDWKQTKQQCCIWQEGKKQRNISWEGKSDWKQANRESHKLLWISHIVEVDTGPGLLRDETGKILRSREASGFLLGLQKVQKGLVRSLGNRLFDLITWVGATY